MKKKYLISNIYLLLGLILMIYSCSQEINVDKPEQETKGWHSAKVNFNINCTNFDQGGGATRAMTDFWQDGDVVYLLLTDKDGNKVQAYVRYDATRQEWGELMYEGYRSYLTCNTERVAEAYYIVGVNDLDSETISLTSDKELYYSAAGTYVYPENGDITVSVSLEPLTGRIRFEGASGTTITIGGLKTYTSFSHTTGQLTISTENLQSTVDINGSTPYIYSVFADSDNPIILINSDNYYKTVFDSNSSILKPGKSGFLTVPTNADHRGWIPVQEVTEITLDKTTLSLWTGRTIQLTATVFPENAYDTNVIWSSSNSAVATVDTNGIVTGVSEGTATIKVRSAFSNSVEEVCDVKVTLPQETLTFTVGEVSFNMKFVEAGTFKMGSTSGHSYEAPVHDVTITKDYYIGEAEVTQALWKAVTGNSPTTDGIAWTTTYGLGDNYPAYFISYEDVQSFITKLNSMTDENFRMPTEAEWEFAARGGNKSKGYIYSGSNSIDNVAWYTDNSYRQTHSVKSKNANELGIYDMSGNVEEWCYDWSISYSNSSEIDPTGPTYNTGRRIYRGGSWGSYADYCRCTYRLSDTPSYRGVFLGFRLALR